MSELDDAIRRLEAAVARLETAADPARRGAADELLADVAARVDAALARLDELLREET
jgi:BMFP domain-containing protein YqiC